MSDFSSPQIITKSGSTDVVAAGADANGNVGGTFFTGGSATGYIDENGTQVSIAPSSTYSYVENISDTGLAVGYALQSGMYNAVTYQVGGSLVNLDLSSLSGAPGNSYALGVSENGKNIVGYYDTYDKAFADIGGSLSNVVVPGVSAANTSVQGVNDSGEVAGDFSIGGNESGFVEKGGAYTEFQVPNSETYVAGVNNSGTVVGNYFGASTSGAFTRDATGNITYITDPSATPNGTTAKSINDSGQVAGYYTDATGTHGFVEYNGSYISVDVGDGTDTVINSINAQGEISGYASSNGQTVGFAERPLPEIKLTSVGSSGPDNSQFAISGTAFSSGQVPETGQTVTILDNNAPIGTTTVKSDGSFSDTLALPNIGTNTVTARITADGVTSTSTGINYSLFQAVRDLDGTNQEVERLFYTILKHAADPTSLATDVKQLEHHRTNLPDIATGLIGSHEFRSNFGHLGNSAFVQQLFEAATGSAIDSATLHSDIHALQSGESRGRLAVHIAQSDAAVAHLAVQPV